MSGRAPSPGSRTLLERAAHWGARGGALVGTGHARARFLERTGSRIGSTTRPRRSSSASVERNVRRHRGPRCSPSGAARTSAAQARRRVGLRSPDERVDLRETCSANRRRSARSGSSARLGLPKSVVQRLAPALATAHDGSRRRAGARTVPGARLDPGPPRRTRARRRASRGEGRARTTRRPSLARAVIERTLAPLLRSATEATLFDLRICDPAMGSGAFLVEAARYLMERLEALWLAKGDLQPSRNDDRRRQAMRDIVGRCLYGVDKDPVAVDLARFALARLAWTAEERPADLSKHRCAGDALVGSPSSVVGSDSDAGTRLFDWGSGIPRRLREKRLSTRSSATRRGSPTPGAPRSRSTPELARLLRTGEPRVPRLSDASRFVRSTRCRASGAPRTARTRRADVGRGPRRLCADAARARRLVRRRHGLARFRQRRVRGRVFSRAWRSPRREKPSARPRRRTARPRARGRRRTTWPGSLARTDLDATSRRSSSRGSRGYRALPPELFGERGFQSTGDDLAHLRRLGAPEAPFVVPIREGVDIAEFAAHAPRTFLDPRGLTGRFRPPPDWQRVGVLIRQTARYPIAALSDGTAFRNSILAGFGSDVWSAPGLVAYLDSSAVRFLHYMRHRDARQGMPQLKIGHLRVTPDLPDPGAIARRSRGSGASSASGTRAFATRSERCSMPPSSTHSELGATGTVHGPWLGSGEPAPQTQETCQRRSFCADRASATRRQRRDVSRIFPPDRGADSAAKLIRAGTARAVP